MPAHLREQPDDGNGRVWRKGLERLDRTVRLRGPEDRVDVVLTDITAPQAGRAPRVCVVHEASWLAADFAAALAPEEREWVDSATRAGAAAAERVLVPSREGARQVAELAGVDAGRCDVVPYGVDHDAYRPRPGQGRMLADAFGAGGRPYVLFVGVAHPKKNLDVLREAMRDHPSHALMLVLSSSRRLDAEALLAAASAPIPGVTVCVADRRLGDAELAALMTDAACLCLPSLGEGFGLPVAEAMACGTPVVVSDRGSLPEVVGELGVVTGVDAPSVSAGLARALAGDTPDPDALAAHARTLTWDAMADGWRRSLERAVAG